MSSRKRMSWPTGGVEHGKYDLLKKTRNTEISTVIVLEDSYRVNNVIEENGFEQH